MLVPDGYYAARRASAVVDLSARGKIVVAGDDRAPYLQGLLTNDIAALEPGHGCYSAYLTPQGRMVADMCVLNLGRELLLDVHPSVTTMLVDRLREFVFTEDVTVEDRTTTWVALGVHGPASAGVVTDLLQPSTGEGSAPVGADELGGYPEYRHLSGRFAGVSVVAMRSDEIGEVGFVLYADAGVERALGDALARAGAVGLDALTFDLLRIEGGRPAFPTDMHQETIPLEAGVEDRAISLTKGCYVGQEVIIRILHRGQGRVARRLVGLAFAPGAPPPVPGATLTSLNDAALDEDDDADADADGGPVGSITSSVLSPALERPIALGYVKRELAEPGTELVVRQGGRRLSGVVTPRPFFSLPTAGRKNR